MHNDLVSCTDNLELFALPMAEEKLRRSKLGNCNFSAQRVYHERNEAITARWL
jgi:hypothetical protein